MVSLAKLMLIFTVCMAATAMASDVEIPVAASDVEIPVADADIDARVQNASQERINVTCGNNCGCPNGWVESDGRCYFYQKTPMCWACAETHCMGLGAHLVSIHNEKENNLVKSLIRSYDCKEGPTWIGLSDCQKKKSWFWSDGSKVTFTKWNPNEPSYTNCDCCVVTNWPSAKNWNDYSCGSLYPFVCVKNVSD